jgi:hypothetical protein
VLGDPAHFNYKATLAGIWGSNIFRPDRDPRRFCAPAMFVPRLRSHGAVAPAHYEGTAAQTSHHAHETSARRGKRHSPQSGNGQDWTAAAADQPKRIRKRTSALVRSLYSLGV